MLKLESNLPEGLWLDPGTQSQRGTWLTFSGLTQWANYYMRQENAGIDPDKIRKAISPPTKQTSDAAPFELHSSIHFD